MTMPVSLLPIPQRVNRTLGAILLEAGLLSSEQIERILVFQQREQMLFGESAMRLGYLRFSDLEWALARQFGCFSLSDSDKHARLSKELMAAYKPFSPNLNALRFLRTQLMLRWYDPAQHRKVLAVVGTGPRDGRSYVSANLAILMSQMGLRTLLIDANLRTARQHQLFHLDNQRGLSSLLAGRCGNEATKRIEGLSNLCVLPAGPCPPNPLELMSRPTLLEFVLESQIDFDITLIDTPGAVEGEDAVLAARAAGSALLLAQSRLTRAALLGHLVNSLRLAGVTLVGTVLNEWSQRGVAR